MLMKRAVALFLLFLRPAGLDFAAMNSGIQGGIQGMANAQSIPHANFNIPGAGNWADALLTQDMSNLNTDAMRNLGMVDPQLMAAYQQMLGIDASGLTPAGQQAGAQYGDLAQLSQLFGGMLGGQAQGDIAQQNALRQAGGQAYQAGLDPQLQLHDYMQQQVVDNSRAATSARGIGMSANAAGIENQATSNFNMDWQNQQLQRQLAGLQGMTGANSAANQSGQLAGMDLSGAMGYQQLAPGYTMSAAMAPISAQQSQFQMPMDYANMFSQAEGQDVLGQQANVMSSIYPYLGMAQQGQEAQFWGNLSSVQARNAMQQQSYQGLSGGGQSQGSNSQGSWGGNQSGAGDPMNWMGLGSAFKGMGSGGGG